MAIISDDTFGDLMFDYSLYRSDYQLRLFGVELSTILRLQADDIDDITRNQREAFIEFEKNKALILEAVEEAIYAYYLEHCEEYRRSNESNKDQVAALVKSPAELAELLELTALKVMYSSDSSVRKIGLIFDALFDRELGVGELIANEKVKEVSVQDIVLG